MDREEAAQADERRAVSAPQREAQATHAERYKRTRKSNEREDNGAERYAADMVAQKRAKGSPDRPTDAFLLPENEQLSNE